MRSTRRMAVIGVSVVLGMCLLPWGLRPRASHPILPLPPAPPPRTAAEVALRRAQGYRFRGIASPPARGDSAQARRDAVRWYGRATKLATGRVEGLEEWDSQAMGSTSPEARRRAAIAGTRELRMAIQIGERAAHLATTRNDRYEAALLLSRLYCDAGLHDRELAQARILMALSPKSLASLKAMRRAAGCNHLPSLARQADIAIEAFPGSSTGVRPSFDPMMAPDLRLPPSASGPPRNLTGH